MKFTKEYRARYGKKVWGFRARIGGERIQIFCWDERADAVSAYEDLVRQSVEERHNITPARDPVTLAQLVAERVRDLDTDSNKNHKRIKVVLEMFRDHFEPGRLVTSLEDEDVLSYKRRRMSSFRAARGREMRANSINRELEAVVAMLGGAARYFKALKAWRPPRMPYEPTGERGRERIWTEQEETKVLDFLRSPRMYREHPSFVLMRRRIADMLLLRRLTGMRGGEVEKLERDFIDWREELIRLPARVVKTRKARRVPLSPEAGELLRACVEASPHPRFVFTNAKGTRMIERTTLYRCLRLAAKHTGVPYGLYTEGGFVAHDLRHTATTKMLESGAPLGAVSEIVGHSKRTMTLLYDHPSLDSMRGAVKVLQRNGRGSDDEEATKNRAASASGNGDNE